MIFIIRSVFKFLAKIELLDQIFLRSKSEYSNLLFKTIKKLIVLSHELVLGEYWPWLLFFNRSDAPYRIHLKSQGWNELY